MQPLTSQILAFTTTILIGMATGLLYDLYKLLKQQLRPKRWGTDLGDLIFWLCTIALVYSALLLFNWGEVRVYVFIGLAIGVFGYFKLLSGSVTKIVVFVIRGLIKFVVILWMAFLFPFRLLYRILMVPVGLIALLFNRIKVLIKGLWWMLVGRHIYGAARLARAGLKSKFNKLLCVFKRSKEPPKE